MSKSTNVGILGLGAYLPPEIRKNDWWPEHVVARWVEKRAAGRAKHAGERTERLTAGTERVLRAMAEIADDPFQGAVERRVMPEGMLSSDMELEAAKEAIRDAGIDASDIGMVLCNSAVPDHLVTNNACLLHHRLGLRSECFTMATEAACNSFIMSLTLAQQMIASGQAKRALVVQSFGISRLLDFSEPVSPWFGDGATAAIVGLVSDRRGILAQLHTTDGTFNRTIVVSGTCGRRWYEEGRVVLQTADTRGARRMFLDIADTGKDVVDRTLAAAGVEPRDVDFFAVHQGTPWLREVLLELFGLERARSVETFAWTASLSASNIPLGMQVGRRDGLLRDDDLVLLFSGGAGNTCSSMLVRWGA